MIKFGTGGFRGVIGDDFTKQTVQSIAQGLCDIIAEDKVSTPVVVGYDHRFASEYAAEWFVETLSANGIQSLLYTEAMPSPAVMTAVRDEFLDYGVMITASHNPSRFNGVKLFTKGGVDADVNFTTRLEKVTNSLTEVKTMRLSVAKQQGLVGDFCNKQRYLENIKDFVDIPRLKGNKLNVLYNNLYGVGAKCISPLFAEMGVCSLTVQHVERDTMFGNLMPNPTEQSMQSMRQQIVEGNYTFAMATDSDVDRLGIMDEKGNYVSSNDILAMLYYYLVKYRNQRGDIVKNVATSVLVDKLAKKFGYQCHEVDVGFKNISHAIKTHNALIGGESSGGLTVRGYIFGKDSVFSSALFAEMVAVMNKPVSQIVEEVRSFANYDHVCFEDEIRFESEDGLVEYINSHVPNFALKLDHVEHLNRNFKYYFEDDCWALIRLSGTEPVFRVFAEFKTTEQAKQVIDQLRQFINVFNK